MSNGHGVEDLEIDGLRIAFRVDGNESGDALVLINSLGTNLRMWDPQMEALAPHFRIIRYDCRGHGDSDVPRKTPSIDRLSADLIALLDHLHVARAHLCGLSLGGITALHVAAHNPARVHRAVFANTAARLGTLQSWDERMRAVREGGMAAIREGVVARFLGAPFRAMHPEVTRRIGDMVEATKPDGYLAVCAALRDADLRGVVATIRAPSLIIAGELDQSTPVKQSEDMHAAIAGSQLVVLAGAAHLTNVEQAEEFTRIVSTFLRA